MTGMNLASHGTQDMFPTFLQRFWHFGVRGSFSHLCCRQYGRDNRGHFHRLHLRPYRPPPRHRLRSTPQPFCSCLSGPTHRAALWLVAGAFLLQFCVQGAWGVIPAHLSELSPNSIRGFLPGFAYQCGVLLAGPVSYLEALLAEKMSYATAMAATAATVFILTAIVAASRSREKRASTLKLRLPAYCENREQDLRPKTVRNASQGQTGLSF